MINRLVRLGEVIFSPLWCMFVYLFASLGVVRFYGVLVMISS